MTDEAEQNPPQEPTSDEPTHPDQAPLLIGGVDKELLKDAAQASTVQDLSGKVDKFGDIAAAIENITAEAIIKENKRVRRVNRILLIGLAIVILMSMATTYNSFTTKETQDQNKATLQKIDKNQAGIDELVAYLRALPPPSSGQGKVVTDLETLICSSTDSVALLAECNRLGVTTPPQG